MLVIISSNKDLYFLAILLPPEIATAITKIKEHVAHEYNSKAALRSPAHITLHMPFYLTERNLSKLKTTLVKFSKHQSSFEIELKNFDCFPPRAIFVDVLPNKYLVALQKQLTSLMRSEMSLFNADYKDMPYRPHVTVAFRDLKKVQFERAWKTYQNEHFSTKFLARRFSLLKLQKKQWSEHCNFSIPAIVCLNITMNILGHFLT